MQPTYETGQSIQYCLPDTRGKKHWFNGVIHGIRRYEDSATHIITKITYLVDTGRHKRIDEHPYNVRDREFHKRTKKISSQKNIEYVAAAAEVSKHTDLPANKIMIEKTRQPEQIELPENMIRPVQK